MDGGISPSKLFSLKFKNSSSHFPPQDLTWKTIATLMLPFTDEKSADECEKIYSQYTSNHFCDIFLEEPEENLFPPTQTQLINWLLEITEGPHASNLSIATHGLFFTGIKEGKLSVKTATEVDMQEIYDYGVDAFFNLETFAK